MLHQRIKPPSDVTKKAVSAKNISQTTHKKESYYARASSSPPPAKIKKVASQPKLTVLTSNSPTSKSPTSKSPTPQSATPKSPTPPPKKHISNSFDNIKKEERKIAVKNNKVSSISVTQVRNALKESSKKKDCPRFVRESLSMHSKPRLKIQCTPSKIQCVPLSSLSTSPKKNMSNSLESIKKEKKAVTSSIESLKLRRHSSFSKDSNYAKNSPKSLDRNTPKRSFSNEFIKSPVEKRTSFSPRSFEQERLEEKVRQLEENQKLYLHQINELKEKYQTHEFSSKRRISVSSEIKHLPQKMEQPTTIEDKRIEQKILDDKLIYFLKAKEFDKAEASLKLGANINVIDETGETPIFHSFLHDHLEVTHFLKKHHADFAIKNKQGKTILHKVCELNDIERVKEILDIFPKDDAANTLLSALEMKTISNEIKQLIANQLLFIAVKQNDVPLAAKALAEGANVNAQDEEYKETALHKACYIKPSSGRTVLHEASYGNSISMVKCLLRNKSNPSLKDKYGQTPIEMTNEVAIKKLLTDHSVTKTDLAIKTAAAHTIQKKYRLFYSAKNPLKERSIPIVKQLMAQERFDEVSELMRLFKERRVFSLKLKLDYYAGEMDLPFEVSHNSSPQKKEDESSSMMKRLKG